MKNRLLTAVAVLGFIAWPVRADLSIDRIGFNVDSERGCVNEVFHLKGVDLENPGEWYFTVNTYEQKVVRIESYPDTYYRTFPVNHGVNFSLVLQGKGDIVPEFVDTLVVVKSCGKWRRQ